MISFRILIKNSRAFSELELHDFDISKTPISLFIRSICKLNAAILDIDDRSMTLVLFA